jgi:hypothetical protein
VNKGSGQLCRGDATTCDVATCCAPTATCTTGPFDCGKVAGKYVNKGSIQACTGDAATCDEATCCQANYACGKVQINAEEEKKLKTVPLKQTCNLEQHIEYVKKWGRRVTNVMTIVDNTQPKVQDGIQGTMKEAVQSNLLDKIDEILDKTDCSYLKATYGSVINGLCFQFVLGVAGIARCYVGVAWLTFVTVLTLYFLWRYAIDNVNSDEKRGSEFFKNDTDVDKE